MSELKKINLYKIKSNSNFDGFLNGDLATYDHIQCPNGTYEGYIKYEGNRGNEKNETQMPWLVFLNTAFPADEKPKYTYTAFNKFPRALLALKIQIENKDYFYALTFGQHGDSYLEKEHIVHDFGIKVGMNICGINELRRVQTSIHENISRQTERQASKGANLDVFNLNNETEFLKSISAHVKVEYRNIIDSFKGKDKISLNFNREFPLNWENLVEICKRLEERYHATDYRNTEFKVYDILRNENDPQIIEKLDTALCEKIQNKEFDKIHLAAPEFLQEDNISYTYKKKQDGVNLETYPDLFIQDLISVPRRRLANVNKNTLKSWKIYQYDHEQDETHLKWNAYECLVAEIELDEKTYILSNAHWKEFSPEIKTKIRNYFQNNQLYIDIPSLPDRMNIFDPNKGQHRESIYNLYAAQNSKFYLFDQAKINIGGSKKYEICDLLSDEKHLIHVKRYSSGAASINHIFTQAKFYSDAFSTEEVCRQGMRDWIDNNDITENQNKNKDNFKRIIPEKNNEVSESEYTIIFCILYNSETFDLNNLPLMAQYELMNSHRYLTENRKFKCGVVFKRIETNTRNMPDG